MPINIRDRLKKVTPYIDQPNTFNENIGETIGIIVLIIFIGSFLYLLVTGIPTIQIVLKTFVGSTTKLFSINP